MSNSKIKIKMGPIEVEYEGSETFLKEELPLILKSVSELYQTTGIEINPPTSDNPEPTKTNNSGGSKIVGTTSSIAGKLNVKSGTELIIAAAARLTFVLNKEKFSRKDVSDEMKSASAYYKNSYGSNLTKYLNSLVKDGTFLETSSGIYAISANKSSSLKSRLG